MTTDTDRTAERESNDRVVRGGATMFPRTSPRPAPPDSLAMAKEFVVCAVRGPAYATLLTLAVEPLYRAWLSRYLARGHTMAQAFATSLIGMHVPLYFAMFAFYETCDRLKLLRYYKLTYSSGQEPPAALRLRSVLEFSAGQVLNYFLAQRLWTFLESRGAPSGLAPLPSAWNIFKSLSVSYVLNRVLFGLIHRIFHHGPLYRAVHRQHHMFTGTQSIAAEFAHPVEQVGANLFPTIIGSVATNAHPLVWLVWLFWRVEETLEAHSGYCFAGTWPHRVLGLTNSDASAYHHAHHARNRGDFGDEGSDHLQDLAFQGAARVAGAVAGALGSDWRPDWSGTHDDWLSMGGMPGYVAKARKQREAEGYAPVLGGGDFGR